MKRAFTIVELLVVITIVSILLGIVTTAASNSIRAARSNRQTALCSLVETGLATYRAQKGRWPEPLASRIEGNNLSQTNEEGAETSDGTKKTNPDVYVLEANEVRAMVKALVDETKRGNPLIDISGLFVSRSPGESGKQFGLDFMDAVHGTKKSPEKMSTSQMYFGYPDTNNGYFRRFKMVYATRTDHLAVKTQSE